jgi:hypothetical protein
MENRIALNLTAATDISNYRGKIISFLKLQIAGGGKLTSCVINFFNEGDKPQDFAVMKLVKPEFSGAQTLIPQGGCLLILEYDYCAITDVDGMVTDKDKLVITLSEPAFA